jgi:hypothetical protein
MSIPLLDMRQSPTVISIGEAPERPDDSPLQPALTGAISA